MTTITVYGEYSPWIVKPLLTLVSTNHSRYHKLTMVGENVLTMVGEMQPSMVTQSQLTMVGVPLPSLVTQLLPTMGTEFSSIHGTEKWRVVFNFALHEFQKFPNVGNVFKMRLNLNSRREFYEWFSWVKLWGIP